MKGLVMIIQMCFPVTVKMFKEERLRDGVDICYSAPGGYRFENREIKENLA